MMMEYPVQRGCNAHVALGFFCVKIIFDNVDFQLFLTQILYLNSKRVKIGGGQELSTSQAAKDLELTPTSISRASKQLEEMELLHIKKEGVPQFYRFSHPITNQYPAMIELFTRKLDAIQLPEDADERVEEAVEEMRKELWRNRIMSKDEYLITDAPLKALTVFAMPMILGSFFQQVYNMADSIIVGQFVGSSALAAVGACAALTNVFICVALGAGVGAGVLVSRYFGAKEYGKMKTIVSTSLISFLLLSIILGIFGFCFSHTMMSGLQTPADILEEAVLYLRVYFVGFPFLFMYNILSTMFTSIGESKIPLVLLIFSSILNIVMDLWMVAGLGLGVFGAAFATLIAQGISAVFSLLIFLYRMRRYQSPFQWFDGRKLRSMLRIAVPSVLQQSTVSIGMMIVQAVVNPFGTQALAGYAATMRVENVFSLIFVSIGNAVSPYVSQNLGAGKTERIKKGYHAALVLDVCFAAVAFLVIETLHTQISSLFLGKDGTALAYQVSGDYMRWLGYFFIFMGIKMATDGVLRGLGIMRPFLIANMVNLAIRLSVALICAPRFGIAFVWLAVPAGWLANFLVSYAALRKSWPGEKVEPSRIFS